ncbi:MAG TPA: tetratricopeptide repeat protein [Candidatus Methylacidiphilales bacterium]|nr:tetratricopeptide repeat protein [Candidatus Methylacidiphilales bacterium]
MSRKKKSRSIAVAPRGAPAATRITSAPLPALAPVLFVIISATILAYSNCFIGPFLFDDDQAIIQNTTLHLWPPWIPFFPPSELTVGGRPLLNLTFAINYAISGMQTWSYHAFNLLVHILAGLTLFGVLRRTFLQPVLRERFGSDAIPLAAAITLLWLLNPLQTECVTYISQRAEALMGLCYLFTIYCFIRSTEPETPNPGFWAFLAVVTCVLSPFFKEITITAPIMVLFYDRTFVAGTFLRAISRRWPLYLGLSLTWLTIAYSVSDIGGHDTPRGHVQGRVVGYHYGVTAWQYLLTECPALMHYIRMMIWPHPLVIDYGLHIFDNPFDPHVFRWGIMVVLLLIATAVALVRWPLIGFIGAWFFIILAPTSSIFPIVVSPIGEHRLYLPLLSFLVPLALVLRHFFGARFWYPVIALALIYGSLTFIRNWDYSSAVSFWKLAVSQQPKNARAHNNYGVTLLVAAESDDARGDKEEATRKAIAASQQFREATRIQPLYADAHYNWGNAATKLGNYPEAITHFQTALEQKPVLSSAQNNWGNVLDAMGKDAEAVQHYQMALQIDPNNAQFHYNLGHAYLMMQNLSDAIEQFNEALQLNPNFPDVYNTLGIAYVKLGATDQAIQEFQQALRLNPNLNAARENLERLQAPGAQETPQPQGSSMPPGTPQPQGTPAPQGGPAPQQ